jgi:nucleotide-binding universal stress UspA family protein
MIKTILVPWSGGPADQELFRSAVRVARAFRAHLEFLHVRVDPAEFVAAMATADGGSGFAAAQWAEQLEQEAKERSFVAGRTFEALAAAEKVVLRGSGEAHAVTASYRLETGSSEGWVSAYAKTADLVITAAPVEGGGIEREAIEAALLDGGRPTLITGPAPLQTPVSRVAIAWKPTREAARAVDGALPFLAIAKKVSIVTVAESDLSTTASVERLRANLTRHGLDVDTMNVEAEANAGTALLDATRRIGADLLVMGGYGHSRLREFVFGGVTERVLAGAGLPVLMAH